MIGIYKFTNKFDRKVYIGQSVNIENRYNAHKKCAKNGSTAYFHRAIRKYKFENFDFEVLIECPKENLNYWEKFYIRYYCSNNDKYGYNLSEGGEMGPHLYGELNGMYGRNHTEESKKKMSENRRGKKWSPEQREKYNNYIKEFGSPVKGKHPSEESKEKNRQAHLGKKHTEEQNKAQSLRLLEYYKTHEHPNKEKIPWNKGLKLKYSNEVTKKCSDAGKRSGSMFWIYKDNEQKRCLPEELDYYINLGYNRGRIKYTCHN